MLKSTWRFLWIALRPIKGVPNGIDAVVTIPWFLVVLANAALPSAGFESDVYVWVRNNRLALLVSTIAVLSLVAGIRLQYEKDRAASPRLLFAGFSQASDPLIMDRRAANDEHGHAMIVDRFRDDMTAPLVIGILISNDPPRNRAEAIASAGIVSLAFTPRGASRPTMEVTEGRWLDNIDPVMRFPQGPWDDVVRRDLPPNGGIHRIGIAIRYPNEADCFALTATPIANGLRDPRLALPEGQYDLTVTVRATGLVQPVSWQLLLMVEPKRFGLEFVSGPHTERIGAALEADA